MSDKPTALVTGASQGIGAATARAFARDGYNLALVALSEQDLGTVAAEVEEHGVEALTIAGDLADLAFAESTVTATVEKFGRLDVLVNNAATSERETIETISLDQWEHVLRVNLTVPAFLARWAAQPMKAGGRGVIINISSIEAIQPTPLSPAYGASKGGLDSITRNLAAMYGPSGIRVVGIRPGAIDTALSQSYTSEEGVSLTDQLRTATCDRMPLGRWGRAEEIAETIVWLASPGASYITGTSLIVDGGWTSNRMGYEIMNQMVPKGKPQ